MTCKYLTYKFEDVDVSKGKLASDVICTAKMGDCPKKRIVHHITPHCWRF